MYPRGATTPQQTLEHPEAEGLGGGPGVTAGASPLGQKYDMDPRVQGQH